MVPVLAERWLLPRLGGFLAQQKHVSVTVREFPIKLYAYEPPFDVALHYSDAIWPGTWPGIGSICSRRCWKRFVQAWGWHSCPATSPNVKLNGELIQAHPHVQKHTQSYSVFSPQQSMAQPVPLAFIQWLHSESKR